MNKEFWDGLPDHVQSLIKDTLKEVSEWETEHARKMNEEKLEELKACQCINIYQLTDEERKAWEKDLSPVYHYFQEKYGEEYLKSLPRYKK